MIPSSQFQAEGGESGVDYIALGGLKGSEGREDGENNGSTADIWRPDAFLQVLCFMPGYCGGISLGSWYEIDRLVREGIDPEGSPVLGFLIAGDFEGLIHFAEDLGYREAEEGYVSKCDLCLDIRRYVVAKGDFKELGPKEFYDHLE